jgi:hypothetical protein
VIGSAGYELNARTRLRSSYAFSQSDFSENHSTEGLPLGIAYHQHQLTVGITRQVTQSISSELRYSFYQYSESSSGRRNDFTANALFLSLIMKWD